MLLLIDTSKKEAWVALIKEDKIIVERKWSTDPHLGVQLLEVIDELLMDVGGDSERQVLKRIAVHKGPGSHMALRAGVVTAQIMADQLKCELVEVDGTNQLEMIRQAQLADPVSVVRPKYG